MAYVYNDSGKLDDSCFALFLMTLDFLGQHMIIVKLAWGAECLDDL